MSLPSVSITCAKCGFKAAYARGVVRYVYECPDGSKVDAPTSPGWCSNCGTISTIQLGLSREQLNGEIRDLEVEITGKKTGFMASKNDKAMVEWLSGEITDRKRLKSLLGDTYTADRCLACGSGDVVAIDIALWPKSEQVLPITHPSCGGQLVAREGSRFFFRTEERTLSLDHAQPTAASAAEKLENTTPSFPPVAAGLTRLQSFWTALFSIGPALVLMTKSFWLGVASYLLIMALNGAIGWIALAVIPMQRLALFGYLKNALVGATVLLAMWTLPG